MSAGKTFCRKWAASAAAVPLAAAALFSATVPSVQSARAVAPIRLDGRADEWTGVPRIVDPKTETAFAFQNDAQNIYVLMVITRPESLASAEATGLTILGRPERGRKTAKGDLFVTRQTSADNLILWRESQGAVLTEREKAEIRKIPRQPIFLAYATDAKGSSYGPLIRQTDVLPPDFASATDGPVTTFEFRLPLASPGTVPGAIGAVAGEPLLVSFAWGGRSGKILATPASRESPNSRSGYQSGTGRTWGQEFLDTFDSMSRPTVTTKGFSFAVTVALADAREPGLFTKRPF
jgi:hypothetical protein